MEPDLLLLGASVSRAGGFGRRAPRQGCPMCHARRKPLLFAPVIVPWQGNLCGRTEPQQRRDRAGDETSLEAGLGAPGTCSTPDKDRPAMGAGVAGGWGSGTASWWVGITADISSAQGSRARTVRRTSMTVRATTARMEAPVWMVSTPTTASARPSGQVTVLPRPGWHRAGLGGWILP